MRQKIYELITTNKIYVYFSIIFLILLIYVSYYHIGKEKDLENRILTLEHEIKIQKEITTEIENIKESEKKTIINNYEEIVDNQKKDIEQLKDRCIDLEDTANEIIETDKKLLQSYEELKDLTDSMDIYIKDMETRLKYYEDYQVFMYDTSGIRTDCTYEKLEYLESLIKDKSVDNLAFYCSWIMIESEWHADCKNPTSSATGLGQFLSSTGKYTYETLMGNGEGTYNHSLALQYDTNLEMTTTYIEYLMECYNGDLKRSIDNYRGFHDTPYLNRFNHYLSYFGLSIDKVAEESKLRYKTLHSKTDEQT